MAMRVKETVDCTEIFHPECKPGELWLTNTVYQDGDLVDFEDIGYQTKRPGKVAYDRNGKVVPGYVPVFVSTVEYNSRHPEVKIGQ